MQRALLLVDHGSRRQEANAVLVQVAEIIRRLSDFAVVHYAHLEIAEPTIAQGFDACVADGARDVIVHPYFLAPGSHYNEDIPRLVAEAASKHPGVHWTITEPLGIHPKLCEVVMERIEAAVNRTAVEGAR
ncbi:MAG: CbiX/SirB N-terminal domain-containing protein [Candidatus Methylomirabilales bacterium]